MIRIISDHLSKAIEYESRLRKLEIYGPEQLRCFNQYPELKKIRIRQLQSFMDEVMMTDIRPMYREGLLVQAKQALEVLGYNNGNENYSQTPPKDSSEAKKSEKFNVDSLAAGLGGAGFAFLIKTFGPEIVRALGEAFYEGQENAKYKERVNHISQILNGMDQQQVDYILQILTTTDPQKLEAILRGYK